MTLDKRKLESLIANSSTVLDNYLRGAAFDIVNDILEGIDAVSIGDLQVRHNPTRAVIVSSPGDPPNTDMGTLVNSITWAKDGHLRYIVHDGVEYGLDLEEGTSEMAARPFVRPVFEAWRKKLGDDMREQGIIR